MNHKNIPLGIPYRFNQNSSRSSSSVCIGCGRTLGEIAEWGSATASRQHEIVRRSSARMGS
ncbi:DUF1289 domain-containing protein, partial [Sphingorhabdus sp.]|uniref:DUF1289 domain-containing protein n=1 Tax=Sphingorhabdus sp. TaxID=1902408 RepID=UPI0032B85D6F